MKNKDNGKDWQSAWLKELDERTPKLADYVKNEPIPSCKRQSVWERLLDRLTDLIRDKRVMAGAGVFAMMLITVCAVLLFRPTPSTVPPVQHASTVIALEINPSVLMSTDERGLVGSAVALNEDADAVLALDEFSERVIGKPLADAVKAYTDMCAELGFIDYSGDAVRVSGIDSDLSDIEASLSGYFKENGIFAVVDAVRKDEAEFSELYGISSGESGLYAAVSAMKSFYSDRSGEGKELEELLEDYRASVLGNVELYIKEEIGAVLGGLQAEIAEIIEGLLDELAANSSELARTIELLEYYMGDGAVSSELEGLAFEPTSREEYFEKLKEYRRYRSGELKQKHEAVYAEHREALSDSSYKAYISGIISEYGSLSEYFERHAARD